MENNSSPEAVPPSGLRREVKTYVLRAGRMTAAQERAYNELAPSWCIPFEHKKLNFVDVFGNTNPIVIEIGFGMGDATVAIAEANPEINYLGIEVHTPGVGKVLSEIQKRDLKNLYIIEYDALEVLEYMIGDNSVNGFHIFFPDPWPKKDIIKEEWFSAIEQIVLLKSLLQAATFILLLILLITLNLLLRNCARLST